MTWRVRNSKRIYLLIATVALIVVALLLWLTPLGDLVGLRSKGPAIVVPADVPDGELTSEQLSARSKQELGKTVDELAQSKLNSDELQTSKKARRAGQVLRAAGRPKESLRAFKAADEIATKNGEKNPDFLVEYAAAAQDAGDLQLAIELMKRELERVKADPEAIKQDIERIEKKIAVMEGNY